MIIALYSPLPGMGKTTVAKALHDQLNFYRMGFADTLRYMLSYLLEDLYPQADADPHSSPFFAAEKETQLDGLQCGATPRRLLRTLGTDWGRDCIDPDIWVKTMAARLDWQKTIHLHERNIVIDDMRFPNEYDMLAARGAKLVHISRPGVTRQDLHASDGMLDDAPTGPRRHWDEEVTNFEGESDCLTSRIVARAAQWIAEAAAATE